MDIQRKVGTLVSFHILGTSYEIRIEDAYPQFFLFLAAKYQVSPIYTSM